MKDKKNLLFVGSYPPQFGGISSHLSTLIPDLCNEGYSVTSLSTGNIDSVEREGKFNNIHVNLMAYFKRNFFTIICLAIKNIQKKKNLPLRDFMYSIALTKKINDLCKDNFFDHIFFYTWKNGYSIPYLKKILKESTKLHLFIFGGLYEHRNKFLKIKENIKIICKKSDGIFSSSQYCADSLHKILGIGNEVGVIYVGVDTEIYNPKTSGLQIREKFGIPTESVLIVFFGRMNTEMGLDVVLENIGEVLSEHPNVVFLIAGAKNDLSMDALKSSKLNNRVKYWENVPQDDKPNIFAAADLLVSPTKDLHACMGVSIKEAMASGIPVIGSSSGGIPEAIDESEGTGFIVNIIDGQVDYSELRRKLSLLIIDEDLRNKVGIKARQKAERLFSNNGVLEKYKKIMQ